jgi:hypothetical protein
MRNIKGNSLFANAYLRDGDSLYYKDAMLIAVLSHTTGEDRSGAQGKILRKMLDDVNLDG